MNTRDSHSKSFAHYWTQSTYKDLSQFEGPLEHTASNLFKKRGVKKGDYLYVWSLKQGRLFLVGRMKVDAVVSQDQARKSLGSNTLWKAKDHALAESGSATDCYYGLEIPLNEVQRFLILRSNGPQPPVFKTPNKIDQQTLRGVVQLSNDTAGILDSLLESHKRLLTHKPNPTAITKANNNALKSLNKIQADTGSDEGLFDPTNTGDERQRMLASIVMRRGQAKFRSSLLKAYNSKCAISGCSAVAALEAAHIIKYQGPATNHVTNGLLLRADLHTLFDLQLITIDSQTLTVQLHPSLENTEYSRFNKQPLNLPHKQTQQPDRVALQLHQRNGL